MQLMEAAAGREPSVSVPRNGTGVGTQSAPIFVIGVARSGTTLLSMMLDSHSRIAIPYESHFFVEYHKQHHGKVFDRPEERLALVEQILAEPAVKEWDVTVRPEEVDLTRCTTLGATIDQIFQGYARKCNKDVWGEKSPPYTLYVYMIEKMFPNARYVHLIRDGRDVALSLMEKSWGPGDFVASLEYWARNISCARRMLYMLPEDKYIEVRFEQLVSEPEPEMRRVMRFLGFEFEPTMLDAYRNKAASKVGELINSIHPHLKEAPSKDQAFKWKKKLGPSDQALAYEIAGTELEELGYEPGVKSARLNTLRKCYHLLMGRTKRKLGSLLGRKKK
jgi:hypothetical protein